MIVGVSMHCDALQLFHNITLSSMFCVYACICSQQMYQTMHTVDVGSAAVVLNGVVSEPHQRDERASDSSNQDWGLWARCCPLMCWEWTSGIVTHSSYTKLSILVKVTWVQMPRALMSP